MNLRERIGAAILRAAHELPNGYDLLIEIERDAGVAALYIPPIINDDRGQRITNFCGHDLADYINSAIAMAIEHDEAHNKNVSSPC